MTCVRKKENCNPPFNTRLKDKEIAERETDKVKVEYEQLVKDRLELEEVAKSLSCEGYIIDRETGAV